MNPLTGNNNTSRQEFRTLQVLFWALTGGTFFCAVVIIAIRYFNLLEQKSFSDNTSRLFAVAVAVIALVCWMTAVSQYKKGIILAKNLTGSLDEKLDVYRSVLIRYLALCEFPALLAVINYMITGEWWTLVITALLIVAMFMKRPTVPRLTEELSLGWNEAAQL
jgi:hypothetical protein